MTSFSSNRALLLTLRDHPELATTDALLDATRSQVGLEQMAWREVALILDPKMGGRYRWNPKRQAFVYEWQSLVDRQPDLARGPVLDAFMRTDPDWSFVTRDPAWDPRFDALVGVFLFSRDKIEGREPSFAAQELVPVYNRQLEMAVSKAPTKFWLAVPLAGFNYDFANRALRISGVASGRRPEDSDLLGAPPSEPEVALPEGARGRAVYSLLGAPQVTQRYEAKSAKPGVPVPSRLPTDDWRSFASIGSSWRKIPLPGLLALDRRAHLESIPMEPSSAEPLVKAQTARPGTPVLSARVYFDAERVDIGSTVGERQREPAAVLIAKLQRIEVVDSSDRVVATIDGAALPAPAARAAAPAPAATPVKAGPTPAELETERRRRLDQQEAEQAAHINDKAKAQIQKENKCSAEASKVDGNLMSKAYRDAYAACMAK